MKRGHKQQVSHLEYIHNNPKSGCRYKVKSTNMTSMEMVPLREDGSEVRL